jgi:predicted alpha/beta-hydrolase family hydrolase
VTTATERRISTPLGEARLVTHRARSPFVTLLLSHGAGGGIGARDLQALADRLPAQGASVVLLEQPWKVAGRKVASPPPTLDAALVAAARTLRVRTPVVVGGRSAGARSAARSASALGAAGCLALSYPLHPPGRPERSRLEELRGAGVPTLVVQGEHDTMGRPEEFPSDLERVDFAVVPGGDHGLRVSRSTGLSEAEAMEIVVESALEWLVREVGGRRT